MISASGKCEMKFALENFQVDRNDFSRKFLGLQSNGKAFAKKYRQVAPSSATAITPSTSAASVQALLVTVADAQGAALTDRTLQKTPVKKVKKGNKKRKTTTPTPESAEHPSPPKLYKPLDEAIGAHYLGMLPFYTT